MSAYELAMSLEAQCQYRDQDGGWCDQPAYDWFDGDRLPLCYYHATLLGWLYD